MPQLAGFLKGRDAKFTVLEMPSLLWHLCQVPKQILRQKSEELDGLQSVDRITITVPCISDNDQMNAVKTFELAMPGQQFG